MNAKQSLLVLLPLVSWLLPASASGDESVELIPDERAGWSPSNLVAPLAGLLSGDLDSWYAPRELEVETTPPGAVLDLFYVRSNFQKAYEQAQAPVTVVLPSRVEAGPRDSVTIRALLDGYRQQEVHLPVRSNRDRVVIELEPLPNSLVALTHIYLGGRASLAFLTEEALSFRIQRASDGFTVVLNETALAPEAAATIEGVKGALVDELKAQQLGEDLVVRVALTGGARNGGVEPRSRQTFDPVRRLHSFSLNLVSPDGGAGAVERARAALVRIRPAHATGCALRFDRALRDQLDPASLARALAVKGSFTDPYLRAAMKRLGEISPGGVVTLADGSTYRVEAPIELAAASSQAGEVQGYLALLRQFVAELEPPAYRRETLRGLVAPEVSSARFADMLESAEARERSCLAQAIAPRSPDRAL